MRIARELTKHKALLCMRNTEKADILAAAFEKCGIPCVRTDSVNAAMTELKRSLPHVMIVESVLRDGNAVMVHDLLAKEEPIRRIPLIVCIESRTREALVPLAGKKFEAIFIGDIQPKAFHAKIEEILASRLIASPFAFDPLRAGVDNRISSRFSMNLVAANDSNMIFRTDFNIDHRADYYIDGSFHGDFVRATLIGGSTFTIGSRIFASFLTEKVKGSNEGFEKLVQHTSRIHGFKKSDSNRNRVIIFHPVFDVFDKLRPALEKAGLRPEHAPDFESMIMKCEAKDSAPLCLYLHETPDAKLSAALVKSLGQNLITGLTRLLVASRNPAATDFGNLRYIHPPMTVGTVASAITDSSLDVASIMERLNEETPPEGFHDGPLNARLDFKVSLVDEDGVIIESQRPLTRGLTLEFKHELLSKMFTTSSSIKIDRGYLVKSDSTTYQYRSNYQSKIEAPLVRWRFLKESVPRLPTLDECFFLDTNDTSLSPKSQRLAGILRQSINEVMEYYTGDLPPSYEIGIGIKRIPISGMMAVRIPMKGPHVEGQFMFVCRPELMIQLAPRVTGASRSVAQKDEQARNQVAVEIADQIFGKSQFIAVATGTEEYEIKAATAESNFKPSELEKMWSDVVVIPFASKGEKFFVAAYSSQPKR